MLYEVITGRLVLIAMGYDFERGRLDHSAHPFTTSFHPTDVRVTTRVHEYDLPSCLFSCIHEGGHGLYDQGLDPRHYGTPLGESVSLGIHESQSRMYPDDLEQLEAGMTLYDAFYRWSRDATGETHNWPSRKPGAAQ